MMITTKFFIVRSFIVHLAIFSVVAFTVSCSEGEVKPSLNFLGSLLSPNDLFPRRINSQSKINQLKNSFVYETSAQQKKWSSNRNIKKPVYATNLENLNKPSYKSAEKVVAVKLAPKRHATLQEIGVSLDTSPKLKLNIRP